MKKFLLVLVAAVCLTVSAFATTANEERILVRSTSDAGWPEFQANLTSVKFGTGESAIAGYNVETDTVFTAALVVWLCQNQGEPWKTACADKVARFAAFKARNGLGDTITGAELRTLAQGKGVFFPFADASTASAPTPTTVAAASAPTVVPVTPGLSATEVAKVAQAAAATQLQGFDKALQALNAQATAKDEALRELRKQIAKRPSAKRVAELESQLLTLTAARESDESARKALVEQLAAAKAALDTEVSKLPEVAAAATATTIKPIKADVARLGDEVSAFKVDVNGRVSAVEQSWFIKYQLAIAAGSAGLLALLTLLGVANWRRTSKVKAVTVSIAKAEAEQTLLSVRAGVSGLTDRVSSLEAALPRRFDFSFSDELLISDVKSVIVGGRVHLTFKVEGDHVGHAVTITRQSGDYALVDGIVGQTQPVRLEGLPARLKRAYVKGHLLTQQVAMKTASNDAVAAQAA